MTRNDDLDECWESAKHLVAGPRLRGSMVDDLHDAEPEVRFWSAFSLGQLRARQARTALAVLVDDDTLLPGWWSVGDEAADALMLIAGREPPDRDGRRI